MYRTFIMVVIALNWFEITFSQNLNNVLTQEERSIVSISALTAKGDLPALKKEISKGLDGGLTINKIKECLVHSYAYCGFPRSIRGLQTFMEVLNDRKTKGIKDKDGQIASTIIDNRTKYERGKEILEILSGIKQNGPKTGYAAFAPEIEIMLKEHLFADLFERDVLSYAERELVTISVISAIGGAEPMLKSHFSICLNVGWTEGQLNEFVKIIHNTIGKKEGKAAKNVLTEILNPKNK